MGKDEIGAYIVAHEEVGHFLRSVDDPSYNWMRRQGNNAAHASARLWQERLRLMAAEIENARLSDRKRRRKLKNLKARVTEWAMNDPEMIELRRKRNAADIYIENVADRAGKTVVQEYREH